MDIHEMADRLMEQGVAQVGWSDLSSVLPERYRHLPYGVTLLYRLSDAVLDEITDWGDLGPTYSYFQHYRAVNAFLDSKTLWVTTMLERMGYRAMPVAASQSVKDMGEYSGIFPHKTAAVLAGLGWIGKSALFVSPQFGPRVRLATVLTDLPLPVNKNPVRLPGCGSCDRCVKACPACAITGEPYQPGKSTRADLLDPRACSEYMKKAYQHIGRGAVCGICMAVCPYGQKQPIQGKGQAVTSKRISMDSDGCSPVE